MTNTRAYRTQLCGSESLRFFKHRSPLALSRIFGRSSRNAQGFQSREFVTKYNKHISSDPFMIGQQSMSCLNCKDEQTLMPLLNCNVIDIQGRCLPLILGVEQDMPMNEVYLNRILHVCNIYMCYLLFEKSATQLQCQRDITDLK